MGHERLEVISIARGIGITLVVVGHCTTGKIENFIYLFHMPLFFMMSGYLFNKNKDLKLIDYVRRKIETLYIPYIIWNFIFLLFHNIFFVIGFYESGYLDLKPISTIGELIKNIIGILTLTHMEQVTAPTWYLRVLLFSSILFFIINKYLKHNCYINILCFVMEYLCVYTMYYRKVINGSVMIYGTLVILACSLMQLGSLYRYFERKLSIRYRGGVILGTFISLIILNKYGNINIVSIKWENPIFLLITSISGFYMIFGVSNYLKFYKLKSIIAYIGNHTMIILVLHLTVFKFINIIYGLINHDMNCLKYVANADNLFWGFIYSSIGICVPLGIEATINQIIQKVKLFCKKYL